MSSPLQNRKLDYFAHLCAATYEENPQHYADEQGLNVKVLASEKPFGWRVILFQNNETGERVVAGRGSATASNWYFNICKYFTEYNFESLIKSGVEKAIKVWEEKYGEINIRTGHSAAARYLAHSTCPGIYFNGDGCEAGSHNINLRTEGDTLVTGGPKYQNEKRIITIGKGGHGIKACIKAVADKTTEQYYKALENLQTKNETINISSSNEKNLSQVTQLISQNISNPPKIQDAAKFISQNPPTILPFPQKPNFDVSPHISPSSCGISITNDPHFANACGRLSNMDDLILKGFSAYTDSVFSEQRLAICKKSQDVVIENYKNFQEFCKGNPSNEAFQEKADAFNKILEDAYWQFINMTVKEKNSTKENLGRWYQSVAKEFNSTIAQWTFERALNKNDVEEAERAIQILDKPEYQGVLKDKQSGKPIEALKVVRAHFYKNCKQSLEDALEQNDYIKAQQEAEKLDHERFNSDAIDQKTKKRVNFKKYVEKRKEHNHHNYIQNSSTIIRVTLDIFEPWMNASLLQATYIYRRYGQVFAPNFLPVFMACLYERYKGIGTGLEQIPRDMVRILNKRYNILSSKTRWGNLAKSFSLLEIGNTTGWMTNDLTVFKNTFHASHNGYKWYTAIQEEKIKKARTKTFYSSVLGLLDVIRPISAGLFEALESKGELFESKKAYIAKDAIEFIQDGISFIFNPSKASGGLLLGNVVALGSRGLSGKYTEEAEIARAKNANYQIREDLTEAPKKYPELTQPYSSASKAMRQSIAFFHQEFVNVAVRANNLTKVLELTEIKIVDNTAVFAYGKKNIPVEMLLDLIPLRAKALLLSRPGELAFINQLKRILTQYTDSKNCKVALILTQLEMLIEQYNNNVFLSLYYQTKLNRLLSKFDSTTRKQLELASLISIFKKIGWTIGSFWTANKKKQPKAIEPAKKRNVKEQSDSDPIFLTNFNQLLTTLEKILSSCRKSSDFFMNKETTQLPLTASFAKELLTDLQEGALQLRNAKEIIFNKKEMPVAIILKTGQRILLDDGNPLSGVVKGLIYFGMALQERDEEKFFHLLKEAELTCGFRPELTTFISSFYEQACLDEIREEEDGLDFSFAPFLDKAKELTKEEIAIERESVIQERVEKEVKKYERAYQRVMAQYDFTPTQAYHFLQHILYQVIKGGSQVGKSARIRNIEFNTLCRHILLSHPEQEEMNQKLTEVFTAFLDSKFQDTVLFAEVVRLLEKGADPDQQTSDYVWKIGSSIIAKGKSTYYLLHHVLEINDFKIRNNLVKLFMDYGANFFIKSPLKMNLLEYFLSLSSTNPISEEEMEGVLITIKLLMQTGLNPLTSPHSQSGISSIEAANDLYAYGVKALFYLNYANPISMLFRTAMEKYAGWSAAEIAYVKGIESNRALKVSIPKPYRSSSITGSKSIEGRPWT